MQKFSFECNGLVFKKMIGDSLEIFMKIHNNGEIVIFDKNNSNTISDKSNTSDKSNICFNTLNNSSIDLNIYKKTDNINLECAVKNDINNKFNNFEIRDTSMPDVYELYDIDVPNLKIGYASVPDALSSKFLLTLFNKQSIVKKTDITNLNTSTDANKTNGGGIYNIHPKKYVYCEYNDQFSKWKPIKEIKKI